MIAQFGQAIHPVLRVLKDEETQRLSALLVRRRQLVDMLTAEKPLEPGPATHPEGREAAYRLVRKTDSQDRR